MSDIDVFNGDADGICALTQLRLAEPRRARLVTGVKRDIELLGQVEGNAGDRVTVLDVSLDKNRADVERLLAKGVEIFYVDHHFAGEIPQRPGLTSIINEAPDVCTSLLVNGHLKNRYRAWAVTGAFGDNLRKSAETLSRPLELAEAQLRQLQDLGTCLNYNGYGESIEDLHFAPEVRRGVPRTHMGRVRPHNVGLGLAIGHDDRALSARAGRFQMHAPGRS